MKGMKAGWATLGQSLSLAPMHLHGCGENRKWEQYIHDSDLYKIKPAYKSNIFVIVRLNQSTTGSGASSLITAYKFHTLWNAIYHSRPVQSGTC